MTFMPTRIPRFHFHPYAFFKPFYPTLNYVLSYYWWSWRVFQRPCLLSRGLVGSGRARAKRGRYPSWLVHGEEEANILWQLAGSSAGCSLPSGLVHAFSEEEVEKEKRKEKP